MHSPHQSRAQIDEDVEDEDCLSTIRQMKDMIENKSSLYDNSECRKYKENNNKFNKSEGLNWRSRKDEDAEVDFSLTMNEEEVEKYNKSSNPYGIT